MGKEEGLKVIEAAREYGQLCTELARQLPRKAPAGMRTQFVESAQAVSAMLSEGFGRGTTPEKIHYSRMANGSLEESQDYLRKIVSARLIEPKTFYRLWNLSVAVSRMLQALIMRLERGRR